MCVRVTVSRLAVADATDGIGTENVFLGDIAMIH